MTTKIPTTVAGFERRYRAETKEIDRLGKINDVKHGAVVKIVRSFTFIKAERLGSVRFYELCRKLEIRKGSPLLKWHRLIARNAGSLLGKERLPDGDRKLAELCRHLVVTRQRHSLVLREGGDAT